MGVTKAGTQWPLRGMNPLYPWSDGKPMADNSLQYRWIVTLQGNLEFQFRNRPDVFVAADNLIYPVEGDPKICQAPDVYVAFGVPDEDRGSFLVFDEGVFPQVVFEVRSPKNSAKAMAKKLAFYDRYGAEEYYDFDPKKKFVNVYIRDGGSLVKVDHEEFVSPRLGLRFDLSGSDPVVYGIDGRRFLTMLEIGERVERTDAAQRQSDGERQRADAEKQRADAERQRADRMAAMLRAAGIDPDAPG